MNQDAWHQILTILKQKSTIAGLVGLVGALYAAFGHVLTPEQSAGISSALLAFVSVVAIAVQPKPKGGRYSPKEYRSGDTYIDDSGTRHFDGEKWS